MIRTVHFQLNIGYPWQAPTIRTALEGIAGLKNLQKLCVVGFADLVDLKPGKLIDAKQWKTRKHLLLPFFRGFSYIREVDIFLPIMHNILIQENDESVLGSRLHGLTVEQRRGREDALCACVYFPEKLGAPPLSEAEEVELNQGI